MKNTLSKVVLAHLLLRRSTWLKRSGRMGSVAPTAAIACPCGNLAPEGANKASSCCPPAWPAAAC